MKAKPYSNALTRREERWDGQTPPVKYVDATINFVVNDTHYTDGVNQPDFKARIKQHKNATTAYSGHSSFVRPIGTTLSSSWYDTADPFFKREFKDAYSGTPPIGVPPFFPHSVTVSDAAVAKLMKRIKQSLVSFETLTFVGELREAATMLRRPFRSIRDLAISYLDKLKKRRGRQSAKALSNVLADAWLELQFGWKPLVIDITNLLTTLKQLQSERQYTTVTSSHDVEDRAYISGPTFLFSGTLRVNMFSNRTVTYSTRCKAEVQLRRVGGITLTEAQTQFGLRLIDFVPTAWELLPWSFLVDYFTNVGDYVQALAIPEASVVWNWRTQLTTVSDLWFMQRDDAWFDANPSLHQPKSFSGGNTHVLESFRRDFLRDTVPLSFSLALRPNLSPIKLANISALLAKRVKTPYF